jgi:predicted DNA-binding ribbon-helix-helix protein
LAAPDPHLNLLEYCFGSGVVLANEAAPLRPHIVKRSIVIDGHKTSVSLEDAFWSSLKEIAHAQRATLSTIVEEIDKTRQQGNLSSAIRLFVLDQVRTPGTRGVSSK